MTKQTAVFSNVLCLKGENVLAADHSGGDGDGDDDNDDYLQSSSCT